MDFNMATKFIEQMDGDGDYFREMIGMYDPGNEEELIKATELPVGLIKSKISPIAVYTMGRLFSESLDGYYSEDREIAWVKEKEYWGVII